MSEEKQEPEKPKKKKAVLSLPMMIIIGVVILAVLIGGTLFAVNMMVSSIVDSKLSGVDTTKKHGEVEKVKKEKSEEEKMAEELEAEDYFDEKPTSYLETGRIITNPRSSSTYIVLNLGLEYRQKLAEGEEPKEGAAAETDASPEMKRLMAKIKDVVNTRIASMSESDIEAKRDSMKIFFKNDLTPIFKREKKFLKDLILVEYIKQ